MITTLILLSFTVICSGQLIYPDDYNLLKTSTISTLPPYLFSTVMRQPPPSVSRNVDVSYPAAPQFPQIQAVPPGLPGIAAVKPQQTNYPAREDPKLTGTELQDWSDHVNNIIVNGILKFALDIEREIYKTQSISMTDQRENIVFSPISLAVTLAIVLAGSAGRTFDEVSKVLGLEAGVDISRNSEIVHQMFGLMLNQLQKEIIDSPGPRLDFATASYVQDGYPILPQFKAISNQVYQTEAINVDFAKNGKGAQDVINAWVNQKTMGKISSILNDAPEADTKVILLSALYFNGEWNQYFIDGATKRKSFFIEPNEAIDVDMMYNGGTFPFYEDKQLGVKILGLPYKGQEFSMYVLLPTAKGARALREFQNKLTVDIIDSLIKNMKNETCIIGLPRMKLTSSLRLKSTLARLGLVSLFSPEAADLSLLSQPNNITPPSATPTVSTANNRPGKNKQIPSHQESNDNDVVIFPRFGPNQNQTNQMNHMGRVVKRNYFTYEDRVGGYTVEQWVNGFSLRRNRNIRELRNKRDKHSYTVQDGFQSKDNAKVVNLEENKYRFQKKDERQQRTRRQSRPINQDFLNFVREKNFPSYGLDDLRNSAQLVNPRLFASEVLHKVEIDITEKGTEAAAVTSVSLERDGSQKRFIANRPFIFFIRHDPTGLVLFWGTLNAPTPNYPAT